MAWHFYQLFFFFFYYYLLVLQVHENHHEWGRMDGCMVYYLSGVLDLRSGCDFLLEAFLFLVPTI